MAMATGGFWVILWEMECGKCGRFGTCSRRADAFRLGWERSGECGLLCPRCAEGEADGAEEECGCESR